MNKVVEVKNFSKSFGNVKAVSNLSFDVLEGETFAFLGANGSGKTTTIRSLLGIYSSDEGELKVFGAPFSTEKTNLIGYLPEERGLYLNSTVEEVISYFAELKGVSKADSSVWLKNYLERVEIPDKAKTKIKKLSSGQQQKVQLGVTLVNNPKLLILDEPTKGLDPVNRSIFMNLFKEMNAKGTTIIFSTHQLDEVESIANRVLIIKQGKEKVSGTISEIKKQFAEDTYQVKLEDRSLKFESAEIITVVSENKGNYFIKLNANKTFEDLLKYFLENKIFPIEINKDKMTLNEIFIKVNTENE